MVWEYQAFGNAGLVRGIFDGVKGIISTPEYTTLIILLSLASFFYLVPAKALAGKMSEVLLYILTIVVGVQLIFSSTMDVRIIDRLGATAPVVSTDIPIGIGVPITAINSIGWEITQWYETNMATNIPVALKLSHGAPFNAGSKILQDMNSVRIVDPVLSSKVTNYIRDCKLPEIMVDPTEYTRWFQNADIFDSLASTNNVRFTKGGGGVVKTCKVAFDEIKVIFDAPADNPAGWFSNFKNSIGLNNNASVSALQGSASSLMTNAAVLDAVTSQISGGNFTSNQFFVGNLISPQINDAISNAALLTGSDEILTSMNIEQGRKAQSAGWVTAAILFQDMAGYLFSALNLLVIGLSPIMILGIFIPKFGTKIVSSFVKVLVWLALWWPGLALVNHISTSFLMSQVTGETMLDYSAAMPWQGASASLLSAYGSNATMASGFLATVIPMIMWSLITGSGQAFTAALQGASGRAEAQGAAKGIASNSYEEGKIGYNNVSANKIDNVSSQKVGDAGRVTHLNAGNDSTVTNFTGANSNQGATDITETQTLQQAISKQEVESRQKLVNDTYQNNLSETSQQSAGIVEAYSETAVAGKAMGTSETAGDMEAEVRQTARQLQLSSTAGAMVKEDEGASNILGASIGAGMKLSSEGTQNVKDYLQKGSGVDKEDVLAQAGKDWKKNGDSDADIERKSGALGKLLENFDPTASGEVKLSGNLTAGETRTNKLSEDVGKTDSLTYSGMSQAQKQEAASRVHSEVNASGTNIAGNDTDTDTFADLSSNSKMTSDQLSSITTLSESTQVLTQSTRQTGAGPETPGEAEISQNEIIQDLKQQHIDANNGRSAKFNEVKGQVQDDIKDKGDARNDRSMDIVGEIDAKNADAEKQRLYAGQQLSERADSTGGGGEAGAILLKDAANEMTASKGQLAQDNFAILEISNDVYAVPTGLQGVDDGNGGRASDMTYSIFKKGEDEPMYENVAFRANENDGVSLVQLSTEDKDAFSDNLKNHIDETSTSDGVFESGVKKANNAVVDGVNSTWESANNMAGAIVEMTGGQNNYDGSGILDEDLKSQTVYNNVSASEVEGVTSTEIGVVDSNGAFTIAGTVSQTGFTNIKIGSPDSPNQSGLENNTTNDDGGTYVARHTEVGDIKVKP